MDRHPVSHSYAYVLILTLIGAVFSVVLPMQQSSATHSDIELEISGIEFQENDDVTISGTVNGADETDQIDITIEEAGGSDISDSVDLDSRGDYDYVYNVPNSPDDGVYQVKIEFGSDDPVYGYFIVDEQNDDIDVTTNDNTYRPGDDVIIDGTVSDEIIQTSVDIVEITVLDPNGDRVVSSADADIDSQGDFEYNDLTIDDASNAHGLYAIKVEYDNVEAGWQIFEVVEDSGNSDMTAQFSKTSYRPGDEVVITGSIDENDVDPSDDVLLDVRDPSGVRIAHDNVNPENNGDFEFRFDLADDADTVIYKATLKYTGYNDKIISFTVSTSTSGGSTGGSGSGSNAGLTAKLSDTSLLAGEILTVTGVVPRIIADQPVNIVVLAPDGQFVGVSSFPDPESDKSYSATLRLPGTLEVDEDYSVVISYDSKDIKINFDITGKASGSTGPVTVETDKPSYGVGSTVRISGDIAEDTFREGEVMALQVYNPDKAPYRIDPISPESDGSYDYSMVVGGPLGVTGKWQVKVTYAGQVAETTFDLTGGVASKPSYDLKVEGASYSIEYQSDGNVNSMYVRPLEKKLVVSIDGEQEGTLTITLPREVIDAIQGGSDVKYLVSTLDTETGDQKQVDITESSTTGVSRILVIDYDAGTDLIEIQGTTVVPEFGPLSAIVLAITVLSIIAVTARFSSRFNSFRF